MQQITPGPPKKTQSRTSTEWGISAPSFVFTTTIAELIKPGVLATAKITLRVKTAATLMVLKLTFAAFVGLRKLQSSRVALMPP
jgi:hypothetical protein